MNLVVIEFDYGKRKHLQAYWAGAVTNTLVLWYQKKKTAGTQMTSILEGQPLQNKAEIPNTTKRAPFGFQV